jgi:hypothetical protein
VAKESEELFPFIDYHAVVAGVSEYQEWLDLQKAAKVDEDIR